MSCNINLGSAITHVVYAITFLAVCSIATSAQEISQSMRTISDSMTVCAAHHREMSEEFARKKQTSMGRPQYFPPTACSFGGGCPYT